MTVSLAVHCQYASMVTNLVNEHQFVFYLDAQVVGLHDQCIFWILLDWSRFNRGVFRVGGIVLYALQGGNPCGINVGQSDTESSAYLQRI